MTTPFHPRSWVAAERETLVCAAHCALPTVIDALPAMLWVGDASGARRWIGSTFSAFTGRAVNAKVTREWIDALHPEDVERCCGIQLACGASARPYSLDYRLCRRDGQFRWFMDLAAPQRTGRNLPFGYAGVCVDIHERRELEDQLAEHTRRLRTSESAP